MCLVFHPTLKQTPLKTDTTQPPTVSVGTNLRSGRRTGRAQPLPVQMWRPPHPDRSPLPQSRKHSSVALRFSGEADCCSRPDPAWHVRSSGRLFLYVLTQAACFARRGAKLRTFATLASSPRPPASSTTTRGGGTFAGKDLSDRSGLRSSLSTSWGRSARPALVDATNLRPQRPRNLARTAHNLAASLHLAVTRRARRFLQFAGFCRLAQPLA